jgi:hypothetical protein
LRPTAGPGHHAIVPPAVVGPSAEAECGGRPMCFRALADRLAV